MKCSNVKRMVAVPAALAFALPAIAQPMPSPQPVAPAVLQPDADSNDPLRPPGTPDGYVLIEEDILIPAEAWYTRSFRAGGAWPDGIIPFEFDPALTTSNQIAMLGAMNMLIQSGADVEFIERTNEADYIYVTISIIPNVSYSSGIGRIGGDQAVAINSQHWDYPFLIAHELLHALGFWHEQSRPDRDQNVLIEWNHIQSGYANQFEIRPESLTLGTPYDFTSIMHYGACSFSNCSSCSSTDLTCRTITTFNPAFQSVIGNRDHFGMWDLTDLQLAYGPGDAYYATSYWPFAGNGTIVNPWSSLATAIANAGASDVWCHGGSTWSNVHLINTPVTIRAHGGNAVLQ